MHIDSVPVDRRRVTAVPWLNVRDGPSLTALKIGKLDYGAVVYALGAVNGQADWIMIGFGGGLAYAYDRYLSKFWADCWPCDSRVVTQHFGARPDVYSKYGLPGHGGIDIAGSFGEPIRAIQAGKVYRVVRDPTGQKLGKHVRIEHVDNYKSISCHLSTIGDDVLVGTVVESGFQLGDMGNTGNVWPKPDENNPLAGTHLHLAMKHPGSSWPYDLIDPWPHISPVKERNCHA